MRVGVVADIHGNLPALQAVTEDIARRGVDIVVNLGDHASGPLWPHETVAFLMQQPWVQIAGNCDRQLVRTAPTGHNDSDRFAFERLAPAQLHWLAGLPATATLSDTISLVHGTPSDDATYLLEVVHNGQTRLGDTLIVNPGSVGLPAYEHGEPEPHVMETGSPDARYAILEQSHRGWRAELIAIAYDHLASPTRWTTSLSPG